MTTAKITDILNKKIPAERLIADADMKQYTSFKAGGRADLLVMPGSYDDLVYITDILKAEKTPYMIMGNGSNILVKDGGYRGVIIRIDDGFSDIQVRGTSIIAGAGALMSSVARKALEAELTGFEFASGIPGSIGGGVFMNAGAYGGEIADVIEYAKVLEKASGSIKQIPASELELSYRHSALQQSGDIVLEVKLNLKKGSYGDIAEKMKTLTARRNEKQPVQYPSAGSFFKRPEGYFAGKLIMDSGLAGYQVGGAQVSEKHCGFVINAGGATARDVRTLMDNVRDIVYKKYGVTLEPEVKFLGDFEA